jgi:AraC-like DNA-binding protein
METLIDTEQIEPRERFEAWAATVSQMFVNLEPRLEDDSRFHGLMRAAQFGQASLSYIRAGPQIVSRTRRLAVRHEEELCKVTLQLSGTSMVEQDGRVEKLSPGELTICDHGRQYLLAFDDDVRLIVLMFSLPLLSVTPQRLTDITARPVPTTRGMGAMVGGFLMNLAGKGGEITGETAARLGDNTVGLVDTLIQDCVEEEDRRHPHPHQILLLRVQSYIERNLGNPDLSPEEVAAVHHVSRRQLYKLFEQHDTSVVRWMRERRLHFCARDLASAELAEHSVNAIASRWGMPDHSRFCKLFKAAYGLTPREYREYMLRGDATA